MKILILGHKSHGKTTAAEIFCRLLQITYADSSWFCGVKAVYPVLKHKYGYQSMEECHADRNNHRAEWYELIAAYNEKDPARLTREILAENSIYCGLRNDREYNATWYLYDLIVWVDASATKPLEPETSMKITYDPHRMIKLDGNGDEAYLERQIISLLQEWR